MKFSSHVGVINHFHSYIPRLKTEKSKLSGQLNGQSRVKSLHPEILHKAKESNPSSSEHNMHQASPSPGWFPKGLKPPPPLRSRSRLSFEVTCGMFWAHRQTEIHACWREACSLYRGGGYPLKEVIQSKGMPEYRGLITALKHTFKRYKDRPSSLPSAPLCCSDGVE